MEMDRNTRIIDLTLGEFDEWMESKGYSREKPKHNYVYGYCGIMELFDCSESKAYRLRNGILKDAVIQGVKGGAIIVDVDKAVEMYNKKEK